jgi:hypothetical protein
VVLFALTTLGGALLYPQYRIDVRPALEDMQNSAANGVFEIKEHLGAIGLGLLPMYWLFWQRPLAPGTGRRASESDVAPRIFRLVELHRRTRTQQHQRIAAMTGSRLTVFSIVFGILYFVSFYYDLALFRYYPEVSEFHFLRNDSSGW